MTATLKVKVSTKASCNAIRCWQDDELKISVTAVPENGKANAAVIKLLAKALGVQKTSITIASGSKSPRKVVVLNNVSTHDVSQMLVQLTKAVGSSH